MIARIALKHDEVLRWWLSRFAVASGEMSVDVATLFVAATLSTGTSCAILAVIAEAHISER